VLLVGAVVVAGLLVNLYLALVARLLPDTAAYGRFGAFWSIALVVGFGAFLPLEQELARVLQTAVRPASAMRVAAATALALAAVEAVAVLLLLPVLRAPYGGSTGLALATFALCGVSAVQFLVRGMLIGTNRLDVHAGILTLDAALRVVLVLLLSTAGTGHPPSLYAWTLVVAILCAHAPALPWLVRRVRGRAPAVPPPAGEDGRLRARPFAGAIGHLLVASLCAQLLLNGPPLLVAGVATSGQADAAGRFLAAFTLARVPLFIAVPIQSALVPGLARQIAEGRRAALVRSVSTASAALLALAAAGGALAAWIGPWLVGLVFGDRYAVSGRDLAAMVVAVMAHLGLLLTAQALVAAGGHRRVAVSWGAAVAAGVVPAVLVGDLFARGELAFLVGSLTGWVVATVLLLTGTVRRPGHAAVPDQAGVPGLAAQERNR
jgi:O-antigen/teichoic acid export membrane protein